MKFVDECEQLQELSIHAFTLLMENKGCIINLSDIVYEEYIRKVNEIMTEFGKKDLVFLLTSDWADMKSQLMMIADPDS